MKLLKHTYLHLHDIFFFLIAAFSIFGEYYKNKTKNYYIYKQKYGKYIKTIWITNYTWITELEIRKTFIYFDILDIFRYNFLFMFSRVFNYKTDSFQFKDLESIDPHGINERDIKRQVIAKGTEILKVSSSIDLSSSSRLNLLSKIRKWINE